MEQIIYIFFGWLLGLGSTYAFRWFDRKQRLQDFINGLQTELQEILPTLVGNTYLCKSSMGEVDSDLINWIHFMYLEMPQKSLMNGSEMPSMESLLRASPEELSDASRMIAQSRSGKGIVLKKYYLHFLENNMSLVSLLDYNMQGLLLKVANKLKAMNEEVDRYFFYFEKTFDPNSMNVNKDKLNENMNNSCRLVGKISRYAADDILRLLSMLKHALFNRTSYRLINFVKKCKSRLIE